MPKAIHLNIPKPCHENWQQMTPNEQGRHCMSCQKTVVDFSMMSDSAVVDFFNKSTSQVCGRFADDQLQRDIAIPSGKKKLSWGYFWSVLVATFLVTGKTYAQGKPVVKKVQPKKVITEQVTKGDVMLHVASEIEAVPPANIITPVTGRVYDSATGQALSGASVRIQGGSTGTIADPSGHFTLKFNTGDEVTLEVSAIGYKTQIKALHTAKTSETLSFALAPNADMLGGVEVIGYDSRCVTMMAGGIVSTYRISKTEKIKRKINDWVPTILKKDVQVYPNPVVRGNAVNVVLRLPKTGEYKSELIAANGQVVAVRSIQVTSAEQKIMIPTESAWNAGVYWLRIVHPQLKKVYQNKVVVQ